MPSDTELARFLDAIAGSDRFGSPRNLSLRAHLSQNTVGNIIESGRGSPESLIKLAPLVGKTRAELFRMAGWLEPVVRLDELTAEQQELLDLFDRAPPTLRRWLLLTARELEHLTVGQLPGQSAERHQENVS